MAKAKVNGAEFYYEETGRGLPLTLVHGFGGLTGGWEGQVAGFSDKYRVIVYDLRGQGQSQVTRTGNSAENYVLDHYHLLRHLKIERTILVGHSMGAFISLKFTLDHPDMVKALVLVSANGGPVVPAVVNQGVKNMATVAAYGIEALADVLLPVFFSPDFVKTHPEHVAGWRKRLDSMSELGMMSVCAAMTVKPSLLERLPEIKVPTLIILGDKDIAMPLSNARALNQGIPNSKLVIVPGGSHMFHEEQPQLFNSIVSEFLEGTTGAG